MFSQQQKQTIIWYAVRRLSNKKMWNEAIEKNILKRIFLNLFQFELQKFEIIFPLENIECVCVISIECIKIEDQDYEFSQALDCVAFFGLIAGRSRVTWWI